MDRLKSSQQGEESEERSKKENAGARKGVKVAKHCFFRGFVVPAGTETSGEMKDEKLHAVVARSRF